MKSVHKGIGVVSVAVLAASFASMLAAIANPPPGTDGDSPAQVVRTSEVQVEMVRAADGHYYLVATRTVGYSGVAITHAFGCETCRR